jgi:CO dehydrogenase maturation factor
MTTTIALAGKGGVGKTSISALVIKYLIENQQGSILAIDADPSSNLNMVLGLDLRWTVGDIREELLDQVKKSLRAQGAAMGAMPGGMTKKDYLDYEIRSSLAEGDRVDLIAMGRSEGPGCYCAVNHNLRQVVDDISANYRFVVIDNEAGLEHLSRRTTRDVQIMLIVSDPSQRGIVTAERVAGFRDEFDINIENAYLILNGLRGSEVPPALQAKIDTISLPFLGAVPYDETLMALEQNGQPFISLDSQSAAYRAVSEMMQKILPPNGK